MVTKDVRRKIRALLAENRQISNITVEKLLIHIDEKDIELERYRKALQEIVNIAEDCNGTLIDMANIAEQALKEEFPND